MSSVTVLILQLIALLLHVSCTVATYLIVTVEEHFPLLCTLVQPQTRDTHCYPGGCMDAVSPVVGASGAAKKESGESLVL